MIWFIIATIVLLIIGYNEKQFGEWYENQNGFIKGILGTLIVLLVGYVSVLFAVFVMNGAKETFNVGKNVSMYLGIIALAIPTIITVKIAKK